MPEPITILLVHGAWHGPWCWTDLIPHLHSLGHQTSTVSLPSALGVPGITQEDDATAVRSALDALGAAARVVVVAHSYAGPIASAAILGRPRPASAEDGGIVAYVALAAYIFPSGMDQGAAIDAIPGGLPYVDWDTPAPGVFVCNDGRNLFYAPDTPAARVEWAMARLRPQSTRANRDVVPRQSWMEEGEKWKGRLGYVMTGEDRVVKRHEQEAMIEAAGGKGVWEVRCLEGSGHSPFFSRPEELSQVLDELCKKFEKV